MSTHRRQQPIPSCVYLSSRSNDPRMAIGPKLWRQRPQIIKSSEPYCLKKYDSLCSDLRGHVVSYLFPVTLREYARCSKCCHLEIQKYNIAAPRTVELQEKEDGIYISMDYPRAKMEKKLDSVQETYEYLLAYFKNVKGHASQVTINMSQWSSNIVNMVHLAEALHWTVTLHKTNLEGFMEFMSTPRRKIEILKLEDCEKVEDRAIVPRNFFKADFLKSCRNLTVFTDFRMSSQRFLEIENCVVVNRMIDLEWIRGKARQADGTTEYSVFAIDLTEEQGVTPEIYDIFPSNGFEVVYDSTTDVYHIGDYVKGFRRENGAMLCFEFLSEEFDSDETSEEDDIDETSEEDDE